MGRSTYYNTCEACGALLDPGERCDCEREAEEKAAEREAS